MSPAARRLAAFVLASIAATATPPTIAGAATGKITTIAGTGANGHVDGPAASAQFGGPLAIAATTDGGYLVADQFSSFIRRISPTGTVSTIAGSTIGFGGDGGPATSAKLDAPSSVSKLADGTILTADANNNRIRLITPSGSMGTYAGNGCYCYGGDGGNKLTAQIKFPYDAQQAPDGSVLIVEHDSNRIRKVDLAGNITTVAGNGGTTPVDGVTATASGLNLPTGVAPLPGGAFLIADADNHRIRKVDAAGKITTVAGGGTSAPNGVAATSALLGAPIKIAVMPDGGYAFTDQGLSKVLRVSPAGTITTVAGTGTAGFSGDGGPGPAAQVNKPYGIAVDAEGDLLIADTSNHRIRKIDLGDPPVVPPVDQPVVPSPATGGAGTDTGARSPSASFNTSPLKLTVAPASTFKPNAGLKLPTTVGVVAEPARPGQIATRWDLSGDGKGDISCGADTPALTLTPSKATKNISVSARPMFADGVAGLASPRIDLGPAKPATAVGKAKSKTFIADCGPDLSLAETLNDSVGLSNCKQRAFFFGLVDGRACIYKKTDKPLEQLKAEINRVRDQRPDLSRTADLLGGYTNGVLKLDGMTLTPLAGTAIGILPAYERIVGKNVKVTLGDLVLQQRGPLDWDLNTNGKAISLWGKTFTAQDLFTVPATGMPAIGGFPRTGQVKIRLQRFDEARTTTATINLSLPDDLTALSGRPPATATSLQADNEFGVHYGALKVDGGTANIGPVSFRNIHFQYYPDGKPGSGCAARYWEGSATAYLLPGVVDAGAFDMVPTDAQPRNGIGFCNGLLDHAGGTYTFGGGGPNLFPSVRLIDLTFGIGTNPPLIRGSGTVKAGFAKMAGGIVLVAASGGNPYTFSGADGPGLRNASGLVVKSPTIGVGGQVDLKVPWLGKLGLADGYLIYSTPDMISVGGSGGFDIGVFSVNGQFQGSASLSTGKFDIRGSVRACLFPIVVDDFCTTVLGFISSKGASVCAGDLNDDIVPGIGYGWGAPYAEIWFYVNGQGGCKPSHYWINDVKAARARAARVGTRATRASARREGGAVSFTVKKGEDRKNVKVLGDGGQPRVAVRTPDGTVVSNDERGFVRNKTVAIVRSGEPKGDATYIGVIKGDPGDYTVTPLPGSAPITGLEATRDGGDRGPTGAVVRRDHDQYELSYDAGPSGEKLITFVERGPGIEQTIGTSKGGNAKLRFTPAIGPAGKREIVAKVQIDGVPGPDVVVATYTAPSSLGAGGVSDVSVQRSGKGLIVSWRGVARADGYSVRLTTTTGAEHLQLADAKRKQVKFAEVAPDVGGRVTVSARGVGGTYGPGDSASFEARSKPANVIVRGEHRRRG